MTNPALLLIGLVCAAGSAGGTVIAALVWTGRYRAWNAGPPAWWPYGQSAFKAYVRAFPSVCAACWAATAAGFYLAFTRPCFGCGLPPTVSVLLLLLGAAVLAALSTAVTGWPRFIVPPRFRS